MVEAVVIMSQPAADPRWTLARVGGLPVVERHLMALRRAGVSRVCVLCGEPEHPVVAAHLQRRRGDPRLPAVTVELAAPGPTPAGAVDGRLVYHPALLSGMLSAPGRSEESDGPGDRSAGERLYREDVTTPGGRRRARRAIRQSLRKPTDGWFARTIDRSVSLAISGALAPLPIHPNAVTLGTLVVGAASGWLATSGTYLGFVAGSALFLLASVLDGVDGELARMKFQESPVGQWLDTACDDLTNALYLAGVTVGAFRATGSLLLAWTGVAALALDVAVVSFLYWQLVTAVDARTLLAFEETILAPALRRGGAASWVARLQPLIKRDLYAPLFLLFALAGFAWLALPATAIALAITLVFVLRDFARTRGVGARAA